jgi:hypothetical protein
VIHPLSNHHDIVLNNLDILIINTSFDLYDEEFGTRGMSCIHHINHLGEIATTICCHNNIKNYLFPFFLEFVLLFDLSNMEIDPTW